ncbi:unnamed protein product, partial [Effrenium voratum]
AISSLGRLPWRNVIGWHHEFAAVFHPLPMPVNSGEVKDGGPSSGTYTAATYQGAYPKHEVAKRQTMSLRAAVKACDPDAVRRALEKLEGNAEAALDATDGMGRTLLHVSATRLGSADVTDMLLAHKARPDVRDANDQTPLALILAAVAADDASDVASAASVVSSLLCARAMVCPELRLDGRAGQVLTLVQEGIGEQEASEDARACKNASQGMCFRSVDVETLAQQLMVAVDNHDVPVVEDILSRVRQDGKSVLKDLVRAFDVDGNTLLHRCAGGSNTDGGQVVELLVESKADVNSRNLLGETPLLSAARCRQLEVIAALLRAGADPSHPDTIASETALMEAACRGDAELCRLLLQGRADPLACNHHGRTARDLAIENRHSDVVHLFAEFGITGEAADSLQTAELVEALNVAEMHGLLSNLSNADLQRVLARGVDGSGRQLLHIAASLGGDDAAADMARLLIEFGAPVDDADFQGNTPLSLAVGAACAASDKWPALDTIRALLVAGAFPDQGLLSHDLVDASNMDIHRLLQAFGEPVQQEEEEPALDLEAQCAEESIPLEKLGPLGAKAVLVACCKWRGMSVKQLRTECADLGIPTDGCVEKAEVIGRLRQLHIWQALPLSMLQEEVRERGLEAKRDSRAELEDLLLVSAYNGRSHRDRVLEQCKTRRIPVDKFAELDKAEVVLKQVQRLEASSAGDLKREFARRGLTVEAGIDEMLARLTDVLVWEELPLIALQKACSERSLSTSLGERDELIKRLLSSIGQVKVMESRFKNFFNYGNPSEASQAPKGQSDSHPQKSEKTGFGDEFDRAWEAKAAENRRAFAAGNRNHAGMPSGQRRFAGPGGPGGPGVPGPGRGRPTQAQKPPVERYFRSLGLPPSATHDEVRKAYRKLALQYHPDKNPGQKKAAAEVKFREVAEAYDKVCEHLRTK